MTGQENDTGELLSRGLDADLDRAEMRGLYRLLATDPAARDEAARMAGIEDGLAHLARASAEARPRRDLAAGVLDAIAADAAPSGSRFGARVWAWLRSPHGLRLQPLSFAAGVGAAALLAVMLTPAVQPVLAPEPARFTVHDVQFEQASARLDWTYQFIVMPGGATRIALDIGDDLPMRMQFEAAEPLELSIRHTGPNAAGPGEVHRFTVDGIGFASLSNPRAGDMVTVHNNGRVPVVVYAYTNGYGGSWVLPADGAQNL